jgi:hypothetical protein
VPAAPLPIPFPDYQRIFRVLKAVFDGANADPEQASVFFSVAGAFLMQQVYKRRCQPVAGEAFFRVDDADETILSFGERDRHHDDNNAEKDFHCWILCEGHVIDFMAPLFRESLHQIGIPGNSSRKMFQKPLGAMSDSPLLMRKPGDFYMLPDVDLTRKTLAEVSLRKDTQDLLDTCLRWYRKPPQKMPSTMVMGRGDGGAVEMKLSGLSLTGVW